MAFVSGSFRGSSLRWTVPEKESNAIVASFTRLAHVLVLGGEFSIFTDHKNILYMLSPTRIQDNLARQIAESQKKHSPTEFTGLRTNKFRVPSDVNRHVDLLVDGNRKIYIPPSDEELQLRIIVAAHSGFGGHRGYTATSDVIKEKVAWSSRESDVKEFVQGCLVCLLSGSGSKIPRPLGHQLHAEKVGELLHFDYLYIGESKSGCEYILILKDDFSGYVFLRACKHADAETTAEVLMEYFTTFVPVLT